MVFHLTPCKTYRHVSHSLVSSKWAIMYECMYNPLNLLVPPKHDKFGDFKKADHNNHPSKIFPSAISTGRHNSSTI